jgi:hypothetical protein
VKVLFLGGYYAGKVVDLRVPDARRLVKEGRAVWPEGSPFATPPPETNATTSTRPDLEVRDEGRVRVYRKKKQGR